MSDDINSENYLHYASYLFDYQTTDKNDTLLHTCYHFVKKRRKMKSYSIKNTLTIFTDKCRYVFIDAFLIMKPNTYQIMHLDNAINVFKRVCKITFQVSFMTH